MTGRGRLMLRADAPREQWLAARRLGVTATDVVKIVCPSQWGNAIDVYLDCRLGGDDQVGEAGRWGQVLEDPIAREWAHRHQARVRRVGLMAHPLHPHHLASCDRRIVGRPELLEVKTRSGWAADEWDDNRVPQPVVVQAQWQLHVTGLDAVHIAALIRGAELVERRVDYDPVIVDLLIEEAERVWTAVQAGIPPELPAWQLTATSLERLHPQLTGTVDLDPARVLPLVDEYRAARDLETWAQAAKETARVQLLELLGDAEEATVAGQPSYSWRTSTKTTIPADNVRRLTAEHPDIAAQYVTTTTSRRFHLEAS